MSELVDLGVVDKRLAGLERPASSGITSGLARALAHRLDFDLLLVRVTLVFLAVFTGIGVAIYAWGTLLTPRAGHEAPIRRLLPSFAQWSRLTQLLIIGGSTVLLGMMWGAGSAGTGLAITAIAVTAWWLISRRRSAPTGAASVARAADPFAEPAETYDQWQARMRSGIAAYPEPFDSAATPGRAPLLSQQPRRSWWGGLLVLTTGGIAAAAFVLLGVGNLTTVLSASLLTMGLSLVVWSLARRSRRIPGVVLVICLLLAAATVPLSSTRYFSTGMQGQPMVSVQTGSELDYVNATEVELDLSHLTEGEITINAVMSQITVIVAPGTSFEVNQFTSRVDLPPATTDDGLIIEINAVGSQVTGVYP